MQISRVSTTTSGVVAASEELEFRNGTAVSNTRNSISPLIHFRLAKVMAVPLKRKHPPPKLALVRHTGNRTLVSFENGHLMPATPRCATHARRGGAEYGSTACRTSSARRRAG